MTDRAFNLNISILLSLVAIFLAAVSCRSSEKFTGFSYDPEGATVTTDKETQPQYKRIIGVDHGSIWVSNEFSGARMNDFYQVNDSLYRVVIEPENHPVNNSPWYAFKIWGDSAKSINLQLSYQHGEHRYIPKLSSNGKNWNEIAPEQLSTDTVEGTATLSLDIGTSPLWVSAQELVTMENYRHWMDSLSSLPYVRQDTIGTSHNRRPIVKLSISGRDPTTKRGLLIITGRQHPPEVTGAIASKVFINQLTSDSRLASTFRKQFEVWAYPLVNPDGVQQGHWRHNSAGIDLNRDWKTFNQPETRAVRDDLLTLKKDSLRRVYYGIDFHSTNENIFYPIERKTATFPEDFTYAWIDSLKQQFPDFRMKVEPFDTSSPITKNWIYHTFGADAVTYETNDQAHRDSIRTVTRESAKIIMRQLLEAKNSNTPPSK